MQQKRPSLSLGVTSGIVRTEQSSKGNVSNCATFKHSILTAPMAMSSLIIDCFCLNHEMIRIAAIRRTTKVGDRLSVYLALARRDSLQLIASELLPSYNLIGVSDLHSFDGQATVTNWLSVLLIEQATRTSVDHSVDYWP